MSSDDPLFAVAANYVPEGPNISVKLAPHELSHATITPPPSPPPQPEDIGASAFFSRVDGTNVFVFPAAVTATFMEAAKEHMKSSTTLKETTQQSSIRAWFKCLVEDDVAAAVQLAAKYPSAVSGSFFQPQIQLEGGVAPLPTFCAGCLLGSDKVVGVS